MTIRVCESISCMIAGADDLIEKLSSGVDPQQVRVVRAACIGRCAGAPAARVGDREVENATVEGLLRDARERATDVIVPKHVEVVGLPGTTGSVVTLHVPGFDRNRRDTVTCTYTDPRELDITLIGVR